MATYVPAVGEPSLALTLHYDGSTWTQIANPAGSVAGSNLIGVDAIAGKAVAVGEVGIGTTYRTLAMSWTGTVWRMQATPSPDDHSVLSAVSRVAWNDAWAVGQQGVDSTTLIEHWDGMQWTVVPSANPGDGARLDAITRVPGSTELWAVGSWHSGPNNDSALLLRWNGASWEQVAAPSTLRPSVFLFGVAAVSKKQVWAVGDPGYALKWDGSSWMNMPVPSSPGGAIALTGIDVVPHSAMLWAVGDSHDTSRGAVLRRC